MDKRATVGLPRRSAGRGPLRGATVQLPAWQVWAGFLAGLFAVTLVPVGGLLYALERSKSVPANAYTMPGPREPELAEYLFDHIGLGVGKPFRGSAVFLPSGPHDIVSVGHLLSDGVPN